MADETNPSAVPAVALQRAREAKQGMDRRAQRSTSKTIRDKCVDCSGGSWLEVQQCQVFDCPLWLCRFGKRPATVHKKTPELLDPEFVLAAAYGQGAREMGRDDSSGMPQDPTDRTLMTSCQDDSDQTAREPVKKSRSRKPR
jgi:hypothetical protein